MKKIMYLLNYTGDGGTEKYVLNLMTSLGKERCVFVYSEPGPFLEKFKALAAATYQVKMTGPFDIKAAAAIKKIANQEGVDCIHAQFLRENYIALLSTILGAKVKVIWTYHVNVPMSGVITAANRMMTKLNHRIIPVAEFMKQQLLQKGVSADKLTVIYNGIKVPASDLSKRQQRNEKIISVIGRLSPEKGHRFLFVALAKLKKDHPDLDWKLNIVGDGILKQELIELAKSLELESQIIFKGFVNNMESEYINSDIIVLPSENEAFPFVALEALAYKKPVIATNVGGLPEIIKHDETGVLVPYGDVLTLSDNLHTLLTDELLASQLAENGNEFFLKNLTFDKMLKQTLAVYNLKNN